MDFASALRAVRTRAPLVHCITNIVTVNDCANILLAAGASPTMAYDIREVEESVAGAQALVLNMGAIEDADAMVLAGKRANALGIPVVLDPVAAGVTALRREVAERLLRELHIAVIRGNASEIRAMALCESGGSGVDVAAVDAITEKSLPQAVALAQTLARRTGGAVAISGPIDVIADSTHAALLRNGCATMSRITGSGCMVTTLAGAFCGALPDEPFRAACAALAVMGVCGELADAQRIQNSTGNASFRTDLIDAAFNLTEEQLTKGVRYEIYQG